MVVVQRQGLMSPRYRSQPTAKKWSVHLSGQSEAAAVAARRRFASKDDDFGGWRARNLEEETPMVGMGQAVVHPL